MNTMWAIFICIIILCPMANSLSMNETILINGNGQMKSFTKIPYAQDSIDSGGNYQRYIRTFSFGTESSFFESNYRLQNELGLRSSYMIAMTGINERLQHMAKISGQADISSDSIISWVPLSENNKNSDIAGTHELSTSFNISGDGELNEVVTSQELGLHPDYIADTWAKGKSITMISGISENVIGISDYERLIAKLPPTKKKLDSIVTDDKNLTHLNTTELDKENRTEITHNMSDPEFV